MQQTEEKLLLKDEVSSLHESAGNGSAKLVCHLPIWRFPFDEWLLVRVSSLCFVFLTIYDTLVRIGALIQARIDMGPIGP
jgi:hypothetical protein